MLTNMVVNDLNTFNNKIKEEKWHKKEENQTL
jgi:hypothetical protein